MRRWISWSLNVVAENRLKQNLAELKKLFKSLTIWNKTHVVFFFLLQVWWKSYSHLWVSLELTLQALAQQITYADSDFENMSKVIFVQGWTERFLKWMRNKQFSLKIRPFFSTILFHTKIFFLLTNEGYCIILNFLDVLFFFIFASLDLFHYIKRQLWTFLMESFHYNHHSS